jgi:hypothetical protein
VRRLGHGLIAGAVGTFALDVATYLDIALHGRPASSAPRRAAEELARRAGVSLGEGEVAANRAEGAGALLGYATGLAGGVVYGMVRPTGPRGPSAGWRWASRSWRPPTGR